MPKKIEITENQAKQFNHMLMRLRRIANGYQTPAQLRRSHDKDWGTNYEECLEMAYENLQSEAKDGARGVSPIKIPVTEKSASNV